MSRARIVIVGPAHPYRGGNALFVSHLYNALSADYDVHVINYTLLYPRFLFPGTTQLDQSQKLLKETPNTRILSSVNPLSWIFTARAIRRLQPDLVAFTWWNPCFGPALFSVSLLLRLAGVLPIVFVTENIVSHEAHFVDRWLTRLGFFNANAFVALSAYVASGLRRYARGNPIYQSAIPIYDCFWSGDCTAEALPSLDADQSTKTLLFFGYVRRYKGLDTLFRAMPAVLEKYPGGRLLIVGEFYEDRHDYERLMDELGIADDVHIEDRYVANEEVGGYFRQADVVVMPYRRATQSGILSIAYAYDRPVVVTRVGGLPESVVEGKTGTVVEPEDPADLAEGILRVLALADAGSLSPSMRGAAPENAFSDICGLFSTIMADKSAGET